MDSWLAFAAGEAEDIEEDPGDGGLEYGVGLEPAEGSEGGSGDEDRRLQEARRRRALVLEALDVWRPLPARPSEVSRYEEHALELAPVEPFALAPLRRPVDVVQRMAAMQNATMDVDTEKLAERYLDEDHAPNLKSKTVIGQDFGINRHAVEPKLNRLACSLVHCDRHAMQAFAELVRASCSALSLYCEYCKYDATAMKVSVQSDCDVARLHLEDNSGTGRGPGGAVLLVTSGGSSDTASHRQGL